MRIQVDFNEVRNAGSKLKNHSASYEEVVNRIFMRIHEIDTAWQGSDSQAFSAQLDSFRPALNEMKQVVDSYSTMLHQSADAYMNLQSNRAANARML